MKKFLAILILVSATAAFLAAHRSGEVLASPSETAGPHVLPASEVFPEVEEERGAQRGYLGVQVNRMSRSLREHFGVPRDLGVLVSEVEPDTPAEAAGLRAGDVVTALDGEPIATPGELTVAILERPDEAVEIEVYRDGSPLSLSATLGQRSAMLEWEGDPAELEEIGQRIAEALENVDWGGFAAHFEEQGREWERWGRELEERFSESMEDGDSESWDEFWEDFGERWGEWGEKFGEHWAEWGERQGEKWAEWGERQGEKWSEWGEDQAERWEEQGEKWAEWGEEHGEKWAEWGERFAESWAERGEDWAELGEELAEQFEDGFESVDWDGLAEAIERAMEGVARAMEDAFDR